MNGSQAPHVVFAYGSLLYDPEMPGALVDVVRARLPGYRRCFNKRSRTRRIPESAAAVTFDDPLSRSFRRDGTVTSLVLGTEEVPGGVLEGKVLVYESSRWPEVLDALDTREGYDPARPDRSGYLRVVRAVTLENGRVVQAVVYLTNASPDNPWYVPALEPHEVARVLAQATPRPGLVGKALPSHPGVYYMEATRRALRPVVDPVVERIATAVRAIGPPFEAIVWPACVSAEGG